MTTPKHIGQKLQAHAISQNLKPAKVAAVFGVKPPSVYDWYKHGRMDKEHYQTLVDWSGKPIEYWLDLRPRPADTTAYSDYARVLANLFDALPNNPACRTRVFMQLTEIIKTACITPPDGPSAPVPGPFVKSGTSAG